ncbi:septum formation initiator family protein [Desulforamulus aquiferis]|uniref:Cell division protein FtsL n=1 Tax=Desulforamulus aquiferis TaxID=1397668 RepID=A0AAW7ZG74_9FIRM|nr:cell division protein FtsL [Desulforamulus aquiferis]MDO7788016.1 cell division protein FtsL [Desulforamulus aquiferis]RYD05499.1 hypothetical protein N752_09135 [Desulforamulus aquiferis]
MSVAQEKFSYVSPQEQQVERTSTKKEFSRRAIVRGKVLLTSCILTMFLAGVTVAYYFSQVAAVGFQITQLQKDLAYLQAEQEYLETQASQLLSLQRVEAIATTRLGMVKPDPNDVVLVAALPKSPQEGQKTQARNVFPEVAANTPGLKEDNQLDSSKKSPVIEAFVDMVSRWEQRI